MSEQAGATTEEPVQGSLAQWLEEQLPDWLTDEVFLLAPWQWIGLALLILLGLIVDRIVALLLGLTMRRTLLRDRATVDDATLARSLRPTGLIAMAVVWWFGIHWLDLGESVLGVLAPAVKFVGLVGAVWAAFRLVDVIALYLGRMTEKTKTRLDDLLVPLVRKSLKVFIVAFGLVFVAENLGADVTSLIAGISLAGFAVSLASQDTVKNLFGTLTIVLDRIYHVGDWVLIGDTEGTIEHVGFRSTRLRTFYNSLITVPNSTLITATVDNMGQRRYRRWSTRLGLTYGTSPEKVEAFCEGVRELVRRHPYTRKDYFHVYLNEFGPSSLNVLIYIFHEVPDWGTELRERHRLMLDILRLSQRLGVGIAFPTQTLQLERATPQDAEAAALPRAADVTQACDLGCSEARAIVEGTLDPGAPRPPPVSFDPPQGGAGDADG